MFFCPLPGGMKCNCVTLWGKKKKKAFCGIYVVLVGAPLTGCAVIDSRVSFNLCNMEFGVVVPLGLCL